MPLAVGAWALCATVLPKLGHLPSIEAMALIAIAACVALAAVGGVALGARGRGSVEQEEHGPPVPPPLDVQSAQRPGRRAGQRRPAHVGEVQRHAAHAETAQVRD